MSYMYMFFKPKLLPIVASQLSEETVDTIVDVEEVKSQLAPLFPHLSWSSEGWASGETQSGNWFEFAIVKGGTLSMRCSFRADYAPDVQRICDRLGWIAVDQESKVFTPNAKGSSV